MRTNQPRCANFNHRNTTVRVRNCPTCGEVVNERLSPQHCAEADHSAARKEQNRYCVDCGEQLIGR